MADSNGTGRTIPEHLEMTLDQWLASKDQNEINKTDNDACFEGIEKLVDDINQGLKAIRSATAFSTKRDAADSITIQDAFRVPASFVEQVVSLAKGVFSNSAKNTQIVRIAAASEINFMGERVLTNEVSCEIKNGEEYVFTVVPRNEAAEMVTGLIAEHLSSTELDALAVVIGDPSARSQVAKIARMQGFERHA